MTRQGRSFDDLVAALAPGVLEEAMERAVVQARDDLADRLARAIVDRALTAGTTEPAHDAAAATRPSPTREQSESRGSEPRPAAASASTSSLPPVGRSQDSAGHLGHDPDASALYAFAIIPARPVDLAGVPGIDGEAALRIIQHGDLGLVVSRMRLGLMDDVSEEDLSETGALATLARRHDEVIRCVFEHGPVLPLRFGTVVADEDGARRLLEEQETSARRRLAHLGTHREWGVRLTRDEAIVGDPQERGKSGSSGKSAARRGAMSGTSYLASRREAMHEAQRAEQQTAALTARAEEVLGGHAVDVVRRGGGPGSALLADLAYLVPADDEGSFLEAAERLSGEMAREGLLLQVTGPWPPYSFASLHGGQPGVAGSA